MTTAQQSTIAPPAAMLAAQAELAGLLRVRLAGCECGGGVALRPDLAEWLAAVLDDDAELCPACGREAQAETDETPRTD